MAQPNDLRYAWPKQELIETIDRLEAELAARGSEAWTPIDDEREEDSLENHYSLVFGAEMVHIRGGNAPDTVDYPVGTQLCELRATPAAPDPITQEALRAAGFVEARVSSAHVIAFRLAAGYDQVCVYFDKSYPEQKPRVRVFHDPFRQPYFWRVDTMDMLLTLVKLTGAPLPGEGNCE